MPRALLSAALCAALIGAAVPGHAAARAYAFTKGSGYATGNHELLVPTLVIPQGTELTLVNLHVWGHSMYSDAFVGPDVRLFNSDVVPFGKSSAVRGVESLKPASYGFFCSNHVGMRGTLTVV